MTTGPTPPPAVDDLRLRHSDGFNALLTLVASGKYSRSTGFDAPEAPLLLAWVRSRTRDHQATWTTFWNLVDSVMPTDARENVASQDVRLYCAAALLGYIRGIDYETPIPNGNGLRFGDVKTRGKAEAAGPFPTVRERKLDYRRHGVARKAFVSALSKRTLPEDLDANSPEMKDIAEALAEALESNVTASVRSNNSSKSVDARTALGEPTAAEVDALPASQALPDEPPISEPISLAPIAESQDNLPIGVRRGRRPVIVACIAVASLVLMGTVGWAIYRANVNDSAGSGGVQAARGAEASSSSLVIGAKEPSIDWVGAVFWVPATTRLNSLPPGDPDCTRPEVRAWLQANGEYQAPLQLVARNRSEKTIAWISDLTARGESSEPTPGYFVECYQGGHGGGGIEAVTLSMDASDGSVGHLTTMPDYFAHWIDPLGMANVVIYLKGNTEFRGTLSVQVTEGAGDPKEVPVAAPSGDAPSEFVWRGAPPDHRVGIVLDSTVKSVRWWKGQTGGAVDTLPACDITACQSIISSTWGQQ